ncbi:SRPBCC domain-containing protein [Pseudochrobactrum sp. AO18b]|uniref:SRPBCC family protein n=1 Tax=Pseudochrobactrum sp. AO18b TaxID=1201036 RepID=UPI00039CFB30|nr:SRPBCC domain-containing protein [Pseudochrobactrum sp. AO18b]MBX8783325.1 hypothetical protein [Ochrobactrum sp. GRS2]
MTQEEHTENAVRLVFEYDLDASPQKVWRAISIPELRANWLPDAGLSETEPSAIIPQQQASYRMRETEPPYLESVVTFQIAANDNGGTSLTIIHELDDARLRLKPQAANTNMQSVMRAA